MWNSSQLRNLGNGASFSVVFKAAVASLVAVLGCHGSPDAVVWAVSKIVVYTLDCHSGVAFAHVSDEVYEQSPVFADRDSSGAVVLVGRVSFVGCPLNYPAPNVVCSRVGHSVLERPVGAKSLAPARRGNRLTNALSCHQYLLSAIAEAVEHRCSVLSANITVCDPLNEQKPEPLAAEVLKVNPSTATFDTSHDASPVSGLVRTARALQRPGRLHCIKTCSRVQHLEVTT